jgi:multiple sugar transport system substrate-binding protein
LAALAAAATAMVGGGTLLAVGAGTAGAASTPTINFYINADASGSWADGVKACNAQAKGAYKIVYDLLPATSDQQLQALERPLADKATSIDVMGMDVDWTAQFANAGWLAPVPSSIKSSVVAANLGGPIKAATWKGVLYGLPFDTNTQLLWYRKDLVKTPPSTWSQMIADAAALAKAGKPHYIEIQGQKYEGLTVWFNTLVASDGGTILASNGKTPTVGAATKEAATIIHELATSPGADPGLANANEGTTETAFENGTAAFMLNWPFVYSGIQSAKPSIFKDMAFAPYPGIMSAASAHVTLGGFNLAVSKFTANPKEAWAAAECLTDSANQITYAVVGSYAPTLKSLYTNPQVVKAYPMASLILKQLNAGAPRPQTPAYTAVSAAIQNVLSPPSNVNPATVNSALSSAIKSAVSSIS